MSPISPFGWNEEASPALDAANLELDRKQTGEFVEAQAKIAREAAEAASSAAAVLKSEPGRFQEIIGAAPLTRRGVFTPTPQTTLSEKLTTLVLPANSTLEAGHGWKLGQEFEPTNSNINFTGEQGLSAQCIKIVTKGAGAAATAEVTRLTAMNLAGKYLRFWFKVDPASVGILQSLVVVAGSGASAFASNFNRSVLSTFSTKELEAFAKTGEWFSWTVNPCGLDGRGGTPNWEAIQDLRIKVEDNKSGNATVYFGGVEIGENDTRYPNGVVSFTFDDCYGSQYTKLAPMLARFGYKGTAYITQSAVGEPEKLTLAQLQHMQAVHDWDVGVHCYLGANNIAETGMTTLSTQQVVEDFDNIRGYLHENGLTAPNHWAIPTGVFTPSLLALGKQKFSTSRLAAAPGAETVPPADPYRLRCFGAFPELGSEGTVGSLAWRINQAHETGGWLIFLIHDVAATAKAPNTLSETVIKEVVEFVNTKGVAVRKVSEVLNV